MRDRHERSAQTSVTENRVLSPSGSLSLSLTHTERREHPSLTVFESYLFLSVPHIDTYREPQRTTHVVEEDLSDVHKHSVPRGHRRQVQPQLHVVHRVAAQVLQLHTRTRANAHAPTHVQMHGHTHTHTDIHTRPH